VELSKSLIDNQKLWFEYLASCCNYWITDSFSRLSSPFQDHGITLMKQFRSP